MDWEKIDNSEVFSACFLEDEPLIRTYRHRVSWKLLSFYMGWKGGLVTNYSEDDPHWTRAYFSVSLYDKSVLSDKFPYIELEQCEIMRLFRETIPPRFVKALLDSICEGFEEKLYSGCLFGLSELEKLATKWYEHYLKIEETIKKSEKVELSVV